MSNINIVVGAQVQDAVSGLNKVTQSTSKVKAQVDKATGALRRHSAASRGMSRSSMGLTRNLGLASLQLQDVAVQASMGTDAMRIMTMQGPQLASIFGPKGMIVGGLIAVAGAMSLLGDKTTKTTFDFKKFGSDMSVAFRPLIDAVQPAIDAVKRSFEFLKGAAMTAINFILTGIAKMATFFVKLPSIIAEAFERGLTHVKLFANGVGLYFNDVEYKILSGLHNIGRDFFAFSNAMAKRLNELFNLSLPEDLGKAPLGGLRDMMADNNQELEGLLAKSKELQDVLNQPYTSVAELKDALSNIKDIDIFSYFSKVKIAGEDALGSVADKTRTVSDMIGEKFGDAFNSFVDRTNSAKDAFRSMAASIIKELFQIFVIKRITGFVSGQFNAAFPKLGGMPLDGYKAIGGPVQRGGSYMVGERGPELFVPSRSGSIVPNNKVGGESVIVNQNINISTGVQQTVRAEIKTLMPQIADAAKSAVADAKRRGGSYGRAMA